MCDNIIIKGLSQEGKGPIFLECFYVLCFGTLLILFNTHKDPVMIKWDAIDENTWYKAHIIVTFSFPSLAPNAKNFSTSVHFNSCNPLPNFKWKNRYLADFQSTGFQDFLGTWFILKSKVLYKTNVLNFPPKSNCLSISTSFQML